MDLVSITSSALSSLLQRKKKKRKGKEKITHVPSPFDFLVKFLQGERKTERRTSGKRRISIVLFPALYPLADRPRKGRKKKREEKEEKPLAPFFSPHRQKRGNTAARGPSSGPPYLEGGRGKKKKKKGGRGEKDSPCVHY